MSSSEPIVDRLLASSEPSIRWKTRVKVLGENRRSRTVRALEAQIRDSPRVRTLLARRDANGRLVHEKNPYSKWKGAHWILATLADIGYPFGDRTLIPVRDQVLELWLAPVFYQEHTVETRSAVRKSAGVPVIQGRHRRCASQQSNALWSLLTLGIADERAADLVERLLHWQWPDGGWNCDTRPEADTCSFMESILPLRALSLAARETGSRKTRAAAKRASQPFLERRLFRRRSDGQVMKREFVELHYPLYWHYDVLHGLKVLAEADFLGDARCNEALDWLEEQRLPDGGWPATKRHYRLGGKGSGPVELVDWGGTSHKRSNEWVTVDSLAVLVAAGRLNV